MRIRPLSFVGLRLASMLCLVMAFQLGAQIPPEPAKAPKPLKIQGTVDQIDKGKMTITLVLGEQGHRHQVIYSAGTHFMMGQDDDNKPGSIDQVRNNFYIACTGKYIEGKPEMRATECVYRSTK